MSIFTVHAASPVHSISHAYPLATSKPIAATSDATVDANHKQFKLTSAVSALGFDTSVQSEGRRRIGVPLGHSERTAGFPAIVKCGEQDDSHSRDHEDSTSSRDSFDEGSVSDIREALDQIFTSLPTPPSSASPSISSRTTNRSRKDTLQPAGTYMASVIGDLDRLPDQQHIREAGRWNVLAAQGSNRHHHRPAPTQPPQYPIPPPPSSAHSPDHGSATSSGPSEAGRDMNESFLSSYNPQSQPYQHSAKRSLSPVEMNGKPTDRIQQPQDRSRAAPVKSAKHSPSLQAFGLNADGELIEEDDRPNTALSHSSSKHPSTSSVVTDSTTVTDNKRVWRISSQGNYLDDFSAAFGAPSSGMAPNQLASQPSQPQKDTQSPRYATPSAVSPRQSSGQAPRGPLLLSEAHEHAGRRAALPYISNTPVLQPYNSANSNSNRQSSLTAQREQKLAILRARQQELLLEQQLLEAQEHAEQSPDRNNASMPIYNTHQAEDTDMNDRSDQEEPREGYHWQHRPVSRTNHRNSAKTITSEAHRHGGEKRTIVDSALQRKSDDMASEFEMAALRAQVAQLQLALKKQMASGSGPSTHSFSPYQNRMRELTAEFMGMPTPDESFAGSAVGEYNRAGQSLPRNMDAHQSGGSYPALDEFGRQNHANFGSAYRHGHSVTNLSMRSAAFAPFSPAMSSRHPASIAASREAYGGPDMPHSDLASRLDESASAMVRPGDDRVDELSAKLDRLEELFRLTALQQQQQQSTDYQTSSHSDGVSRHSSQREQSTPTTMQKNHGDPSAILTQKQAQHGPVRTPSLSSLSSSTQGFNSVRTRSPAASAFMFNATPYPRFVGHGEQSVGSAGSAGGVAMHDASGQISTLSLNEGGQQRRVSAETQQASNTKVEHIRRKGVARFILGSSTTKLTDAHGGSVPSTQVSMSRNRTERVEKPKLKVKSAGRGRVVVVPQTK